MSDRGVIGIFIGLGIVATPISVVHSLPETVQQKIDRGREAMVKGYYLEAIAEWEVARNSLVSRRSSEQADLETEILIYNFLSLGYQEIGDLTKAETAIVSANKLSLDALS